MIFDGNEMDDWETEEEEEEDKLAFISDSKASHKMYNHESSVNQFMSYAKRIHFPIYMENFLIESANIE